MLQSAHFKSTVARSSVLSTKSADVLLKMIIILIELKIVQLCSYNVTEFNYNIYSKRSKSVLYQKMPKYVLESQKLTSLTGLTFSEALIAGVQNPPSEG